MNSSHTGNLPKEDSGSTHVKELKSSFVWPRTFGLHYNAAHAIPMFDGSILSGYETDEIVDMYGKDGARMIEEYLEEEDIQLGDNIVDISKIKEKAGILYGTILVESRKKLDFIRNRVKVVGVATNDANRQRKETSFREMYLSCDCQSNYFKSWFLTATREVMKTYNDLRKPYDFLPPRIIMYLCAHANASLNVLVEKKNCYPFYMWGNKGRAVQTFRDNLDVIFDGSLSRWEKGIFFRDKTDLFNPWRKELGLKELEGVLKSSRDDHPTSSLSQV